MKPSPRSPASRGGLIAAAGLILSALAATGAARVAQLTAPSDPPAAERPGAAAELVFLDEPDGSIQVRRDQDRRLVDLIAPTKGGFVRGVMRGFARDRMMRGIGSGPPFQLAESEGGRLTLTDGSLCSTRAGPTTAPPSPSCCPLPKRTKAGTRPLCSDAAPPRADEGRGPPSGAVDETLLKRQHPRDVEDHTLIGG